MSVNNPNSASELSDLPAPPGVLKIGAYSAIIQAVIAFLVGIMLIIGDLRREGTSADIVSSSDASAWVGTGTAVFIFIVFGVSLVGALSILKGHTWGRGLVFLLQFLLVFVAFYMFTGGSIAPGAITAITVIVTLVGMLHPNSGEWFNKVYEAKR